MSLKAFLAGLAIGAIAGGTVVALLTVRSEPDRISPPLPSVSHQPPIPPSPVPLPFPMLFPHDCVCTREYAPTCGSDGRTYDNPCAARCARVEIRHSGECPSPPLISCAPRGSCRHGESCPPGTLCSGLPGYGCYPIGCPYPICLPKGTRIASPTGDVPIEQLSTGDVLWTTTARGERVAAPLLAVTRTPVPDRHTVVQLILGDGRTVAASPGHPTADGRVFGTLNVGDTLDGSTITGWAIVGYGEQYTYDVLPDGETGSYWANGVLIGSTLSRR